MTTPKSKQDCSHENHETTAVELPSTNYSDSATGQKNNQPSIQEVVRQLDRTLNTTRQFDGSISFVGQDNHNLYRLITFCTEVIMGRNVAFHVRLTKRGRKEAFAASALHRYYRSIHNFGRLYARDLTFAPQIELFFDCYRRHPIGSHYPEEINSVLPGGRLMAEMFNDFITFMREEGSRLGIRKKLADWERNTTENLNRLSTYVPALFDKYARLVVIRIDFLYKSALMDEMAVKAVHGKLSELARKDQIAYMTGEEEEYPGVRETVARVNVKEVLKDREHFFKNMRGKPSLFEHMVGHVWSLEWSRAGGYHLHCALFFDGSKVHKHEYLADQIGKYWETVITQGRGYHHNCNRNKEAYGDNLGVGIVNHNDVMKRGKLMRALSYLAKKDQYVYVTPSAKCKRFGTGRMPRCKSGAGRPRRSS